MSIAFSNSGDAGGAAVVHPPFGLNSGFASSGCSGVPSGIIGVVGHSPGGNHGCETVGGASAVTSGGCQSLPTSKVGLTSVASSAPPGSTCCVCALIACTNGESCLTASVNVLMASVNGTVPSLIASAGP